MEAREIEKAKYLSTVLVLEDEAIIALDLEDMLMELGSSQVVCFDTCAVRRSGSQMDRRLSQFLIQG
jgi:hypothetical protein